MPYNIIQFMHDLNAFPIKESSKTAVANKLKRRADELLLQHRTDGVSTEVSGKQLIIHPSKIQPAETITALSDYIS